MNSDVPLISIAMACYNGERFLTEQLDSILGQTFPNLEIIITDDCSKDGTINIIKRYQTLHPNIFLFENSVNLGVTKTFERCLGNCNGQFIACCDQDDIWMPEKIMSLYHSMQNVQLAYGDSELIDEFGTPLNKKLSGLRKMYSGCNTKGFVFNNVVLGHALLFDARLLQQILPIPANVPHDIWIAYRGCAIGGIHYCNSILTKYRQHSRSTTVTIPQKAVSRTKNKRYGDFENKLNWISAMERYAISSEKPFYKQFSLLYGKKQNGRFAWRLLWFMLVKRKELFIFSRKSIVSQIIEIIKLCRGETA